MDPERSVGFASLLLNIAPPSRSHSSALQVGKSVQKPNPPVLPLRVSKKKSVTPENEVVVAEPFRSNVRSALTSKPPCGGVNDWNEDSDDGLSGSVNVMV